MATSHEFRGAGDFPQILPQPTEGNLDNVFFRLRMRRLVHESYILGDEIGNTPAHETREVGFASGSPVLTRNLRLRSGPDVFALDERAVQIEDDSLDASQVKRFSSRAQLHPLGMPAEPPKRPVQDLRPDMDNHDRVTKAAEITAKAGALALEFFRQQDKLEIESKGQQDFVSQADREVEVMTRSLIEAAFADDGIVGEEQAPTPGSSGFTWVIDPIDGTTNFINGIPAWTVVLAGVADGQTQVGVIHDPIHDETFVAVRGAGATLNDQPLVLSDVRSLADGTTGIGYSNRVSHDGIMKVIHEIDAAGGMFLRNASGALSLAYVAAGRLLGYAEEHMNAWDCLAGQLIVAEAGGGVEEQNADDMITRGGRVVVGAPGVFEALVRMADRHFG